MQTLQQRDPDLSVIVPVYNLEEYIGQLLTSLKAQVLDDVQVEYIFVLNNCTDDSEGVIRRSGLEGIKIINCEEQGCGPARNAGFDISRGEFVWYMDGDDWPSTNILRSIWSRSFLSYKLIIPSTIMTSLGST